MRVGARRGFLCADASDTRECGMIPFPAATAAALQGLLKVAALLVSRRARPATRRPHPVRPRKYMMFYSVLVYYYFIKVVFFFSLVRARSSPT